MKTIAIAGFSTWVLTTLCLTPVTALGQEEAGVLEEIIVTATRRELRLQDLPASVTAFTSQELNDLRVLRPQDLAEQTPGLLTKYGPNGLATVGFYIRGVGINDFTGTVDSAVGIYLDEVFQPTPDMLNFAVFDIERVEVLKGPQGTLYGRNSTGGAINFITAKPTDEPEGYIRGEYSSFSTASVSAAISGPLGEALQGRLAIKYQDSASSDGYSFNRFTDNELGDNDVTAIRGQLNWKSSDNFEARLMYGYGKIEAEMPLLMHVAGRDPNNPGNVCPSIIAGSRDEGNCVDLLGYFDPDNDPYDGDANIDTLLDIESQDVIVTLNWTLPRFTVTSITGYNDFEKFQTQDIDASPFVAADNVTYNEVDNFSQEFRLTSDDSFRLKWIVGGNYTDTDIEWFQTIDLTDLAGIPTSNGADQTTRSWALFGQIVVPVSDKLEFVGGLRYTDEKRSWAGATFIGTFDNLDQALASGAPILSQLPLPPGNPNQGGPLDFPSTVKEKNTDFQAVLKYTPNDDMMYYLNISEAFRSGGYSSAVIFSQDALEPYEPENLRAYEAGFKFTLANNTVRLNSAAYFYDFKDFQATFVRATEPSARLQNAGDVEIIGLEASLDWMPTPRLTINLGMNLQDSEIVSTEVVLPPLDGGPPTTIEGNEIPNAPKFSYNGRVRYDMPTGSGFTTSFMADFSSVGSHFLEPNNREALAESGYFLLNARINFRPQDGPWYVAAWVRNLTDEDYRSAAQDLFLSLGFSEIVLGQPRTWGIEAGYRF
ncbi:MAG: TonB-dependent receptor [Gammaproteobacteria bacterium]|nr:MAG: TonB-dependent receptor [Gammaproteobacteria bacterium]